MSRREVIWPVLLASVNEEAVDPLNSDSVSSIVFVPRVRNGSRTNRCHSD